MADVKSQTGPKLLGVHLIYRNIKAIIMLRLLWIIFVVGCLTFARIWLPLRSFNDFLLHHHHWMEWFEPIIEINGFCFWQPLVTMFFMVVHHPYNNGMVIFHRLHTIENMLYILLPVAQFSRVIRPWLFNVKDISWCPVRYLLWSLDKCSYWLFRVFQCMYLQ